MEDVDIEIFESFCTEKYVNNNTTNKSVTKVFVNNVFNLLDGKVQDVVGFCNNSSAKLAKLKHKVWYRRGTPDQQYIIKTCDRLIVVPTEDFRPTLKALHQATGHGKERVMLHKVADQYEDLPKSAVVKYISMCMTCNRNKAQVTQAPPRVIISQGLFSRCQVDLVDMTRKPSGGYKYIIHLMDHFSKFHLLAPLVQKTQAEVNLALSHMFSVIGIPSILHTDNGAEFGALDRLLQQWPVSSDVVHGRPRHPQSQGLVERGNRVLEEKISAMEATYHGDGPAPWHLWLPLIQYQLNTIVSRVIQMTLYECVFGKKTPSPPPLGWPARVIAQEEVDVEESQEDSQECDPLLDHSYAGSTNGPEAQDKNLSHEAQVETTSAPEAEDENVNVSREAQVGIVNHEKMVDQVMEGIMDWNDAVAWVNRSTTANISDDANMMQQPRCLVKSAIEKELFSTLKGTDSAQVQFMSLARLLRKKITVRNYNEDIYPQEIFGIGEEIILLRVPVQLPSVDGNIRLSHLVPAIPFTPTEKDAMEMCICESFGVCSEDDSNRLVACIVCCRWSHCACIGRHGCKHYQEKEFTCGCDKIRPFQLKKFPVFNNTSLLNVFLKKQRSQLKNVVVKTCSKTSKSWRMRDFEQVLTYGLMVWRLTLCSGLNIPNESVMEINNTSSEMWGPVRDIIAQLPLCCLWTYGALSDIFVQVMEMMLEYFNLTTLVAILIVYCCIRIVYSWRKRAALKKKIKMKKDECRQSLEELGKHRPAPRVTTRRSRNKEIVELPLEKLLEKLKSGDHGAMDVLREYQRKAVEVNKEFNCIVEPIKEAEGLAKECDEMKSKQHKKPLHGLPVSLKENYFLKDYDCTGGMSDYIGKPCDKDAVIVQVLKKQGAVPFVRTNIPQTMMTYDCSNPIYGETVNPHNVTRGPGGSSGGEACIIAAKGSLLGFGNDIGGSIRIPCHMCGVCGLKPTYGRLSAKGTFELMSGQTLINATTGPMAQDVTGLVIAMKALLCDDMFDLDPTVPPIPFRMEIYEKTHKMKIGYYTSDGYLMPVPACERAVLDAKDILERQGHELVQFDVPDVKDMFTEIYVPIIFGDNAQMLLEILKNDIIDPTISLAVTNWSLPKFVQWLMSWVVSHIYNDDVVGKGIRSSSKTQSVYDWWKLAERLQKYKKKFLSLWRSLELDALICPGFAFPAVPNGAVFNVLGGVTYTVLYNLLDYPAGTVPVTKVTKEDEAGMKAYPTTTRYERFIKKYYSKGTVGLPVGVQCVGLPYQEELVLRVMKMLENDAPFHHYA